MKSARGFTLIELLVVVAIIGMLASIVLSSLSSARGKARDTKRVATLKQLSTALQLYAINNNGNYPVSGGWTSQCVGWGSVAPNSVIPGLVPAYVSSMPADPAMNVSTNANCFVYYSDGNNYKLIDYNITDSLGPGAIPSFVDPYRNYGQSYPRPAGCDSSVDTTWAWAVYSGPASMCW
jgi:type II secretion system protein G